MRNHLNVWTILRRCQRGRPQMSHLGLGSEPFFWTRPAISAKGRCIPNHVNTSLYFEQWDWMFRDKFCAGCSDNHVPWRNPGVCSGVLRLVVLLSARIASCETSPRWWKIHRTFRQPESHGVEIYLTPLLIQIGRSEGRWWAQERKWGWGRPAHFWRGRGV